MCVLAPTSASLWAAASFATANAPSGSYAISDLGEGTNYWIKGFLDMNSDGLHQLTEPSGSAAGNPWSLTGDVSGVQLTLSDTAYDFEGWICEASWRLWDGADPGYPRGRIIGSNYVVEMEGVGMEDGAGLAVTVASNGSLSLTIRLARGPGDSLSVFNTLPVPGRRYRMAFDARGDTINQPLRARWYNVAWVSSNPLRSVASFYREEYVLLGTNWQTFAKEVYFDRDPDFIRFGSSTLTIPFFEMSFYNTGPGLYAIDNIRMSEVRRDFPLADIENAGFERGFYGWGDDAAWATTGTGGPETEGERPHWLICTNNPHSGVRCMAILLPPCTNHLWTFEPRLFMGGMQLERGESYLLSYWQREDPPGLRVATACDNFSSGIGKMAFHDVDGNWTRVLIPLYHYAEKLANSNHYVNAGPNAGNAAQIRVDSVHLPWTRQVWVDDFALERVSEDVARAVLTNGTGSWPPWEPAADDPSPYLLTTAFSRQAPFHLLSVTSRLDVPFTVERRDPGAADAASVTLRIADYAGEGVHTQEAALVLTGDTCEATCHVVGFGQEGRLPEGLYTYELSMPGVKHKATDRFYVRDLPPHLANLQRGEGLLGFDRFDLVKALDPTNPVPRAVLGEYDRDHFMKLFADIGARTIRLWIRGRSFREIDMLEDVVDSLAATDIEPLVALNGYVGGTNVYEFVSGTPPAAWNEANWNQYVSNLAVRFKGKIRRWHVANEPHGWPADTYLRILTNTYNAFRAVDSNVTIHAYEQILSPSTLNLIDGIYRRGAAPFVDVVDYHAYNDPNAEELHLRWLQGIVRAWEGGPAGDTPGIAYMGSSNCPVWQTEYAATWSKLAPGNLVLPVERERAALLLSKMILGRAYDVRKFIHYNTRPSFQDNHMFLHPLHAGAGSPAVCLQYAASATFASELTGRDLARVYLVNNARVFEFGPREPGGASVIAAWATAQQVPMLVAEGCSGVEMRRMDGSRRVITRLELTGEPVFLNPTDGSSYDWSTIFGTHRVEVR